MGEIEPTIHLSYSRVFKTLNPKQNYPQHHRSAAGIVHISAVKEFNHDSALITPSNATSAIALAGKALRKQGTKPLQYPLHPLSR
jgi:hypothetical protein